MNTIDTPLIERRRLKAFEEYWPCPFGFGCDGRMEFTGTSYSDLTTRYQHLCSGCKKVAYLTGQQYPRIVHEST